MALSLKTGDKAAETWMQKGQERAVTEVVND
jgi:hypothetical protein